MTEAFIGLEVSITLRDGAVLVGNVAGIEPDLQTLTLQGDISRNGKKLKLRELEVEASEIADIKLHEAAQPTPQPAPPTQPPPPDLTFPSGPRINPQDLFPSPAPSPQLRPPLHLPTHPPSFHNLPPPPRGYPVPPPGPPPFGFPPMPMGVPPPYAPYGMPPRPMYPYGGFPPAPTPPPNMPPPSMYHGSPHVTSVPRQPPQAPVYQGDDTSSAPSTPVKRSNHQHNNNLSAANMSDYGSPRKNSPQPRRTKGSQRKSNRRNESNNFVIADGAESEVLEEFDFEGNLNKFDKARVFAEIEEHSAMDPSLLLVSHNKKANFAHYENVLSSEGNQIAPSVQYGDRKRSSTAGTHHFKTEFGIVVPQVTAKEMDDIYSAAESMGLQLVQMVENAAHGVCSMVLQLLGGTRRINPKNTHQAPLVVVLAASGLKGASAIAIARHLASHNVEVTLCMVDPPEMWTDAVAKQLHLYSYTDGRLVDSASQLPRPVHEPVDLVIDGLCGHNATDAPSPPVAELIDWAADNTANVLSLDVPSGIDSTTGQYYNDNCHIVPKWTVTYGLPKTGLQDDGLVGALYLADIGIPREVYTRIGLRYYPPFGDKYVIPITWEADEQ